MKGWMDCAIHRAFVKYGFSAPVLSSKVNEYKPIGRHVTTYLFPAFSTLRIARADSEVLGLSPDIGEGEKEG